MYFFFLGGEILSQRYGGHILLVSVNAEGVTVSLVAPNVREEIRIAGQLLDNKWHTLEFLYQQGNLNLIVDRKATIICKHYHELLPD